MGRSRRDGARRAPAVDGVRRGGSIARADQRRGRGCAGRWVRRGRRRTITSSSRRPGSTVPRLSRRSSSTPRRSSSRRRCRSSRCAARCPWRSRWRRSTASPAGGSSPASARARPSATTTPSGFRSKTVGRGSRRPWRCCARCCPATPTGPSPPLPNEPAAYRSGSGAGAPPPVYAASPGSPTGGSPPPTTRRPPGSPKHAGSSPQHCRAKDVRAIASPTGSPRCGPGSPRTARRPTGCCVSVLAPLLRRDPDELAGQVCIGGREHCLELLAAFADAGCERVYLWPLGDEPRQLEIAGADAAPAARQFGALAPRRALSPAASSRM